MEKTVPEVVTAGPDGTKGIDYQKLTAVLAEAIKQLKATNDNLASDVMSLREELKAYKATHR
jgi:outer membrane murein-binding lipoprotein Lpp